MKKLTRAIIIIALAIVLFTGGSMIASKFLLPYEITANGQTIAVVKSEEVGKKVIKNLISGYIPEDSKFCNVIVDKDLKLQQMKLRDAFSRADVMSGKEAVAYLEEANSGDSALFDATITSQVVEEESYTPDIEYREDDKMFAGESRIETEGSDGVKSVTYNLTSVNGQVNDKTEVASEIVKEGQAEVIYKGTLGLPEGADWKTYEGAPIYNDGDDVVATALQHLGCPYKYGGKSFTKGIDCVQYVRNIYRMYGVNVPNRHEDIRKFGTGVSLKNAKPGDIICYKHHVAIYIGNGKMAEATRKHGTKVNKVRKGGIITVRRVKKG